MQLGPETRRNEKLMTKRGRNNVPSPSFPVIKKWLFNSEIAL